MLSHKSSLQNFRNIQIWCKLVSHSLLIANELHSKDSHTLRNVTGVNNFQTIKNALPDDDGIFELPLIPLPDSVIYPDIIMPITVDDETAIAAARAAIENRQTAVAVQVKDAPKSSIDAYFQIGTEIALGRAITMPNEIFSVLTEGRRRVELVRVIPGDDFDRVQVREIEETAEKIDDILALEGTLVSMFEEMVELSDHLPDDVLDYAFSRGEPAWLTDFIATTLNLNADEHQTVLETIDVYERMRLIMTYINRELNMLELRDEINGRIQNEMAQNQREMYLREQMRVIQGELGEDDIFTQELDELRVQIEAAKMPVEVVEKAQRELLRLQQIPPMAPEVGVIRTYIDWLVGIPWNQKSDDNLDVSGAETILNDEHYGLKKVKDRILEHIAVRKLAQDKMKSPILCFVGPPGVGKTSMGRSIAHALGREFVRISLGGVRDEAEIRGHRRTYIGAMPGRIIQTMKRAGTVNPVFMLDEIDKLGMDFRGDPSAALLEALDPEQNQEYSDHYLDVPYDLTKVMFITTANDLYPIEPALLDRMEVIEFPGYTEEDKLAIARQFLIPKQLEEHGLTEAGVLFENEALIRIIRDYTYEAGVRNLNREIGTICRKIARRVAEEKRYSKRVKPAHLDGHLGPPQYLHLRANTEDAVGLATGLAWTSGGGDILTIEVSLLPGKGNLTLTGQLGDVMQESAQAALSYMRARSRDLDVPNDDFDNYDVHVHLPEGAVPKDGPSAGITLATAMISVFTEAKVRADWAMTGEITLRGRVLPVGGIKEKVLAAHRNRIFNLLLPEQNRKDLVDVPQKALKDMTICFVEDMQQVMDKVLLEAPAEREREQDRDDDDSSDDSS